MRVVKVGGRAQAEPALAEAIANAWEKAPGSMCVVHGGGDEISALQKRLGLEPKMKNGRRITTADDLTVVRMVLSGLANKRLVSALSRQGVRAVGISGEDGGPLYAEPRDPDAFGFVGKTPQVNPAILHALLGEKILPVISPVSACTDASFSESLNVNGDDAASSIAIALGAEELTFVSDVPGVRTGAGAQLDEIDAAQARELMRGGAADGGMLAKLEASLAALAGGVTRVRIGTIAVLLDAAAGTSIKSMTGVAR